MSPAEAVQTIYQFSARSGTGGTSPVAGLIQAADGALYGTTPERLIFSGGCVYRITLNGEFSVIHEFDSQSGTGPYAGVVQGSDGALYGTTSIESPPELGTVFRLTTSGDFSLLHEFRGPDGRSPASSLAQAHDGYLYGMTTLGGAADRGTLFRLTTGGVFTSLGSFGGTAGEAPSGGVIRGLDGGLYGTTARGGISNQGTVFRLSTGGAVTTLHSFAGPDGALPVAGLVLANDSFFYGVTSSGGVHGRGTVFRVSSSGTLTTLPNFEPAEGTAMSPLIQASDGALYGTTIGRVSQGPGQSTTKGIGFRVTTAGAVTRLADTPPFSSGPLVEASDGNLYGTSWGYSTGLLLAPFAPGIVFRMTPAGAVTTLLAFACQEPDQILGFPPRFCPIGEHPSGGLTLGADGALYGVASDRVFRLTVGGTFSTLATLPAASTPSRSGLTLGSNGRFYWSNDDEIFSVSPAGEPQTVHEFSFEEGQVLSGRLLEVGAGTFYGTAAEGGPTIHGAIFRLTP